MRRGAFMRLGGGAADAEVDFNFNEPAISTGDAMEGASGSASEDWTNNVGRGPGESAEMWPQGIRDVHAGFPRRTLQCSVHPVAIRWSYERHLDSFQRDHPDREAIKCGMRERHRRAASSSIKERLLVRTANLLHTWVSWADEMDNTIIEPDGMLAAGAMLTPGKTIKAGELWAGRPAKFLRKVSPEEVKKNRSMAEHYRKIAEQHDYDARGETATAPYP